MLTFFPFWLIFDALLVSGHWRYEAGHLYPYKQFLFYLLTCDCLYFRSKVAFLDMAMLIMQIQCTILEQYTLKSLLYHITFARLFSFVFFKMFHLVLVFELSRFHLGLSILLKKFVLVPKTSYFNLWTSEVYFSPWTFKKWLFVLIYFVFNKLIIYLEVYVLMC